MIKSNKNIKIFFYSIIIIFFKILLETNNFTNLVISPIHGFDYFGFLNQIFFITNKEYIYSFFKSSISFSNDNYQNVYHISQINFFLLKIISQLKISLFSKYYIIYSFHIIISMICLIYLLRIIKIDTHIIFLIIFLFINLENNYLRLNYGHLNLVNYSGIFLTFAILEKLKNNFNFYDLLILSIISIYSLNVSEYYGFFTIVFSTFYLFFIIKFRQINLKFTLKFFSIFLIFILIILIIYNKFFFEININAQYLPKYSEALYSKYTLKDPVAFFLKIDYEFFKNYIIFIDELFNNKYQLQYNFIKYKEVIKEHGINTQEFSYFYGIIWIFFIILNLNCISSRDKNLIKFNIFAFTPLFLMSLHPIYQVSLNNMLNIFNLPFRSITRVFSILDVILLIIIAIIFNNLSQKKINYIPLFIISFIFVEIYFNRDINKNINESLLIIEYNNIKNDLLFNNQGDQKYFLDFIEIYNNKIKLKNS